MRIPVRALTIGAIALSFSALLYSRAQAGSDHYFPPVKDPLTLQECGSCHLAYPASMLPAASWKRMMADLQNHFGDDASVDAETAATIERYLVANAGDTGGARYGRKLLRGVRANEAPLRITELPRWLHEHDEVSQREWTSKEVGSKANCGACHTAADKGYFDDD